MIGALLCALLAIRQALAQQESQHAQARSIFCDSTLSASIERIGIAEGTLPRLAPKHVVTLDLQRKRNCIVMVHASPDALRFEPSEMNQLQRMIRAAATVEFKMMHFMILNEQAYRSFKDFEV